MCESVTERDFKSAGVNKIIPIHWHTEWVGKKNVSELYALSSHIK